MRVLKLIVFLVAVLALPNITECKTRHRHHGHTHKANTKRLSGNEIKELVNKYTATYGIPEHTDSIVKVIHKESNGYTTVISKSGKFHGMCQFMPRTFMVNVSKMIEIGLLDARRKYSPMNPDDAVNVMVWMWSQGQHRQWGPARHMQIAMIKK